MMHDPDIVIGTLNRLHGVGVKLSLDDFGTGYSSLAYLSRLSLDTLKIDQSFVRDITTNPVNASIAVATIAMAHKLGKSVVAEGVETEGQMLYLRRHDCDVMQGYLFSRPVPPEAITEMLRLGTTMPLKLESDEDMPCLLLVDDEEHILHALKRMLRREGYRILTAQNAATGLELLASNKVQVILSDQRMPEMAGTEFLTRVKDLYPDTVRMVLSGYSEINTVTEAINRGAIYRYLSKPWRDDEVKQEIRNAFRHHAGTLV
jgi:CheY-like chemotaxis protein